MGHVSCTGHSVPSRRYSYGIVLFETCAARTRLCPPMTSAKVPVWFKKSETSVQLPTAPILCSVLTADAIITITVRWWAEMAQ
jgi:hypothetical protein